MSLSDDFAQFTAILNAVAPQIALTAGGQATSLSLAILSVMNQVSDQVVAASSNISVLTASGSALDALAANYGATRNLGTQAVAAVQFNIPAIVAAVVVIPTGTVVQVPALGASQPAIAYTTLQDATIAVGQTISGDVQAQANNAGVNGNVVAGSITQMVTSLGAGIGVVQTNPVDGGTYGGAITALGSDPQTDASFRGTIAPLLQQKYGAMQIQQAVLAVSGVYDCYVVASGTLGVINIFWCAQDGTQPAGTQTLVDATVRAILPVSFTPAYPAFTITQITTINITYSAPSATQSGAIEPLIAQEVVQWIQGYSGTSNPTPGLTHGTTIVVLQLATYVQNFLGGVLTDFKVTSALPTAATTTVYRINAGVSAVVLTRV